MEEHALRKAKSVLDLYASRTDDGQTMREGRRTLARVSAEINCPERSASVPDFARASPYGSTHVSRDVWHTESYRPRRYRRDWDTVDAYWADRRFFHSPTYLPTTTFAGRRYNLMDPPVSLWWYFPGTYYTPAFRHGALDPRDPVYAARYRTPHYDPQLPRTQRPWSAFPGDVARGLRLYKQGLCSFDTLERNWLSPSACERRVEQFNDVYVPGAVYGARRYNYAVA